VTGASKTDPPRSERSERSERGETERHETDRRDRPSVVIPGFLTLVIVGCLTMGLAIYWLLRTMHI
jgi:hypothetical protein